MISFLEIHLERKQKGRVNMINVKKKLNVGISILLCIPLVVMTASCVGEDIESINTNTPAGPLDRLDDKHKTDYVNAEIPDDAIIGKHSELNIKKCP